jgi:adenine phosphoribosyltransferase
VTTEIAPETIAALRAKVRETQDFPIPGILFRDFTPLLADSGALRLAIDTLAGLFPDVDTVVAIESRGFILGAPVAYKLGAGLVMVRKAGKLPEETVREEYALEYGSSIVEISRDAIKPGSRVVIVDDLLATGGTVRASANLVEKVGGVVVGVAVLAELAALNGRAVLSEYEIKSVIVYE